MEYQLTDQLAALKALAEVDRVILESPGIERILETFIARIRLSLQCDGVAVLLVGMDDKDKARLYTSTAPNLQTHEIERVVLAEDFSKPTPDGQSCLNIATLRQHCVEALQQRGIDHVVVHSVTEPQDLVAVLAVGMRAARDFPVERSEFVQAFVDRLSVALANLGREQRLYQQAYYDALTQLPNRQLFGDRLDQELVRAAHSHGLLGLLYIDLDQFKRINDTLGHGAGDELLRNVAERLRQVVKETDTVARLGGDEFAIILPQLVNPEAAARVADRVMSELARPMQLKGQDYCVSASIGVALSPQDGRIAEELIRNADTAMYRAKRRGRNCALFFESLMNTRAMQRWSVETGLFRALQSSQFVLHYQPQFELRGGALAGAEALIRWNAPDRGQCQPAEFIPVAEESGLIVQIGGWALNEACRQYDEWRKNGQAPARLSVNISAEQVRHREFFDTVRQALVNFDVPPWALQLEFPETALLGDLENTATTLRALAQIGVRLALDNFGIGLSALSCLRHYPIHLVKIDRSIVAELPESKDAGPLTAAVVAMARNLGIQTMAEGVENAQQSEFLQSLDCDFAQGHFFAEPLPAAQFAQFITACHRRQPAETAPTQKRRQHGA